MPTLELRTEAGRAEHGAQGWRGQRRGRLCRLDRPGPVGQCSQLRQRLPILRPVCELLRSDDVFKAGDPDGDAGELQPLGVPSEVFVATPGPGAISHLGHDVEVAGVGSPVAEASLVQDGVDVHWESGGLFVREATDAQAGVQCPQRCVEACEVVLVLADQAVAVVGEPCGALGPCRVAAHNQVLDAVTVENLDDSPEVRLGGWRQGPSPS